jgi:hypothetical protein
VREGKERVGETTSELPSSEGRTVPLFRAASLGAATPIMCIGGRGDGGTVVAAATSSGGAGRAGGEGKEGDCKKAPSSLGVTTHRNPWREGAAKGEGEERPRGRGENLDQRGAL